VELARAVGDTEIEADALVTLGSAQSSMGDRGGLEVIARGLDLAGHRGRTASRGYTNLGVAQATYGDLRGAMTTFEAGLERASREGDFQGVWFIRGNLLGQKHSVGEWDEALALVDLLLGEGEAMRYQAPSAHGVRSWILEARGDHAGAAADDAAAVRLSRENDEAQNLWPALVASAWLARRHADRERARALVDEVVQAIAASESVGDPQEWQISLVVELHVAGRSDEARDIAMRLPEGPYGDAARAAAERRFALAADLLAAMGERVLQADLRAHAARDLVAEGQLVEAEEQLERARAFWRQVGATAFLREADELVAEAS
jgi:hypothetical protein